MRKYITGVFFLVLSSHLFSQGVLSIMGKDYVADTLSYRQIAPGVLYSHIYMPDFPLNAFIMKVDLNNPYISVETFQAGDKVGKTERLTDGYTRLSYPGHQCVGGVNGNFWIVPVQGYPAPLLGMPHSGSMRKGEIVSDPNGWNRGWVNDPEGLLEEIGFAVIDKARKLWVDDMIFDGKVSIGPDNEYSVDNVNRLRTQDKLVVFNSYVGFTSRPSELPGTEVVVRPVSGAEWATSQNIDCEVVRIKNGYGGEPFSQGEYVLSGAGKAAEFLGQLSIGEQVCIHMGLCTRKDKLPLSASEMLTGNALVMKNGRLTIRNYNESYNSQNYPRTGIGCSADGKTLLMIVIDRRIGAGASTETMCEILRNAGATSVASLDGGGSAQMMIEKEIVNYPGDGNERAVANGWMLFNSAPVDNQIASISFDDYSLLLPRNAAYKPVILGYNKYGVLIDKNFQSFLLTCDTGIGEIKDHQTFIANGADGNGVLTASYQGYKISKKVQLVDSKICFAQDTMVVDNRLFNRLHFQQAIL
ncbi:MAG: phosphodiester glycosidase family protein [Bacteroidales bacterium]